MKKTTEQKLIEPQNILFNKMLPAKSKQPIDSLVSSKPSIFTKFEFKRLNKLMKMFSNLTKETGRDEEEEE